MTITAIGHSYFDVETDTQLDVWYPSSGVDPNRSCMAEKLGLVQGRVVEVAIEDIDAQADCLLYTSPSPRDRG